MRANGARNLRGKRDVERDGLARADRRRQRDRHHRPIVLVPVVRCDEAHLLREIDRRESAAGELETRDVDGGEIVVAPRSPQIATTCERVLAHPGGIAIPPRVVIKVELQLAGRGARDVGPDERLARAQRARASVQPYVNRVVRVAWREWLRAGRCGARQRQSLSDNARRNTSESYTVTSNAASREASPQGS